MSTETLSLDQLRTTFESHMPLPAGVTWDGDHYTGCVEVIGSFRNATTWDDMWRGVLVCAKEFGLINYAATDKRHCKP